jgi:hypothetical protein
MWLLLAAFAVYRTLCRYSKNLSQIAKVLQVFFNVIVGYWGINDFYTHRGDWRSIRF